MKADETKDAGGGHLDFYKEHGIAPVNYDMRDLAAHFDRRRSLYRSLGLPPVAFKGASVLEVAPGTGQNSLFVAACRPASLDLVEPNPAGLAAIAATYRGLSMPHTAPTVHPVRLQELEAGHAFDIVLCENWLGGLPEELELIGALARLVAPGGVLVLTVVPLSGFFPNVMRKLLGLRIAPPSLDFEARTAILVEAFGPHLATMASMTRSHRDWVHDCMINPHYLNVALPLATALAAAGAGMEVLHTYPRFATDWRWFKGLVGDDRRFNEVVLEAQRANVHNFIDHRRLLPADPAGDHAGLEAAFTEAHRLALGWQTAQAGGDAAGLDAASAEIGRLLDALAARLGTVDRDLSEAIGEVARIWRMNRLDARAIAGMGPFSGLFGRETVYLSLTRAE